MSEQTPTRSAVIALKDEQRTMREGHAFLDEKCLLLAGAMLQELRRLDALESQLRTLQTEARSVLGAALARHGLNGLECYPPADRSQQRLATNRRSLLGVIMYEAQFAGAVGATPPAVHPSPEADLCRGAFCRMTELLVQMAAVSGNLARLYGEYRRTVRRVRALENVLLPEIDRTLYDVETNLEELEQDEALWTRFGFATTPGG